MIVFLWILFYILGCIICRILIIRDSDYQEEHMEGIYLIAILLSWGTIAVYLGFLIGLYIDKYLWKWFKKK